MTTADTPASGQRIFVQIASYRDPECQWTVKDMFEKATYPDRIFAGICWQYDPEEDADCFRIVTRPNQVRVAPFHWKESLGLGWARRHTQLLWEGEEYTLQIDSHMRFVPGWDEEMIRQLGECDSQRPVLSHHPAAYTPPDNLDEDPKVTILRAHLYDDQKEMRCRGEFLDREPDKPLPGAFIAGGYIFCSARMIEEIPYDPHLYFTQDELNISARLYTNGWDVFSPRKVLLYHFYNVGKQDEKRPLHWENNPEWAKMNALSKSRMDHMLGYKSSDDPEVTKELNIYGLGNVRSLEEYEAYCGVNFHKQEVSERGLRCGFIPDLLKWKDSPIYIPELDADKDSATTAAATDNNDDDTRKSMLLKPSLINSFISPNARLNETTPPGIMMIENYLEPELCEVLMRFADNSVFTKLKVVDHQKSDKEKVETMESEGRVTDHVDIDGMSGEILSIFNDVYCNRLASFYGVEFEWYERPQILRYPPGGKYNRHADADHWLADENKWVRTQDRDYSVLLYLNEEYEGGSLYFPNQDFRFKPKSGMLAAFPSGHEFLHEAEPTTSGIRYVIVSWSAIIGTERVRDLPPYASVFVRQKKQDYMFSAAAANG